MADSRQLLSGLEEYLKAVTLHTEQMDTEFDHLVRQWEALYEHFDGNAADEFEPVWNGTSKMMKDYFEHSRILSRVLNERIDDLREFDRTIGLP
jgi:uncharacterized protein YukE